MLLTRHEICMISSNKYLINAMVLWNSDMFIYSQFPATAMLSWLSFHSFIGINVNMFKVFDTSHPEICCQFWCLLYLFKSPDHQSDSSKTVIIIRPVVYRPFSLILKLQKEKMCTLFTFHLFPIQPRHWLESSKIELSLTNLKNPHKLDCPTTHVEVFALVGFL